MSIFDGFSDDATGGGIVGGIGSGPSASGVVGGIGSVLSASDVVGGIGTGLSASGVVGGIGDGLSASGVVGGIGDGLSASGVVGGIGDGLSASGVVGGIGDGLSASGVVGGIGDGLSASGVVGGIDGGLSASGVIGGIGDGLSAGGVVGGIGSGSSASGIVGGIAGLPNPKHDGADGNESDNNHGSIILGHANGSGGFGHGDSDHESNNDELRNVGAISDVASREHLTHGLLNHLGEGPNGGGKGSAPTDIAHILQPAGTQSAEIGASHGAEPNGSFWDQVASAAHSDASASTLHTTALSQAEIVTPSGASPVTETTATHDLSSSLYSSTHSVALQGFGADDAGGANASPSHADLGLIVLHEVSLGGGAFATQMHI